MTQEELERVARKMRDRGLHSSWEALLTFSEDLVGNLVNAYQVLLKSPALSNTISPDDLGDTQNLVRDKLAKALALLTSETQVARWQSEATAENRKHETLGFEESTHKRN